MGWQIISSPSRQTLSLPPQYNSRSTTCFAKNPWIRIRIRSGSESGQDLTRWWCRSCCRWSPSPPHLVWPLYELPVNWPDNQTIKQQIKYSNHRPACHCQHPALWLQGLPRTPRRPWQAGTGPISWYVQCSFWSGPQQTKAWAKFLMIRQISPFALWCHSAGCKALLWWSEGQCWGSSRSFGVIGLVC